MNAAHALGMVAVLLLASGCVNLRSFTEAMQERHVQSCIYTTVFALVPPGLVRGMTVTGGATLEQCHELR